VNVGRILLDSAAPASSSRSKLSSALLIIGLIIFASLAAFQTRAIEWPSAPQIQQHPTDRSITRQANSTLLVDAIAVGSGVPGGVQPIKSAPVSVYTGSVPQNFVATLSTDFNGQATFTLPPGKYAVEIHSSFVNLTAIVTTHSLNTTELDIVANQVSSAALGFIVENQAIPNLLFPWETLLLDVNSNTSSSLNSNNGGMYLLFNSKNSFGNSSAGGISLSFVQQVGVQILNEYSGTGGTTWIQTQVNSMVNLTSVTSVMILAMTSSYTTKEYPTPINSNPNSNSTGGVVTP
jgi:hypothetical protein